MSDIDTVEQLLDQVGRAKQRGVPFLCITTNDPTKLAEQIAIHVNDNVNVMSGTEEVKLTTLHWDVVEGLHGKHVKDSKDQDDPGKRGESWINEITKPADQGQGGGSFADAVGQADQQAKPKNPGEGNLCAALEAAVEAPIGSIIFIHQSDRWLDSADPQGKVAIQAAANLRNRFKASSRMLVFLAQQFSLPTELKTDTLILDDPLPTATQLRKLFNRHEVLREAVPDAKEQDRIAAFASGCSWFGAEQAMYLSLKREGGKLDGKLFMDTAELRGLRHRQIEATQGLSVIGGGSNFSHVYGQDYIKTLLTRIMNGRRAPNGIINVEEINLSLAGAQGDNTGVSQDQVQVLLDHMEKHGDRGIIFFGVPGCSKSWIVDCMSGEFGVDTLQLDLNGLKQGEVGSSESNIREALKVADAVCGGQKLWIATCNSVEGLNEALLRRFTFGIVYFDLPTDDEKAGIWDVQLKLWADKEATAAEWKKLVKGHTKINTDRWSAADIRNACMMAHDLNTPLVDAAKEINPVARQDPHMLPRYRKQAHMRYRSAHTGENYIMPNVPKEKADQPFNDTEAREATI